MKVVCGKEELLRGILPAISVVSPKSSLPILSNILLETEKNKLRISATDLEVGIASSISAEISSEGSLTVPAKRFSDIIREMPDDASIELRAADDKQISLKSGKSHFTLMGLPKSDYPVMPDFPEKNVFTLERQIFKSMLRKASFAVSNDPSRYVLNGVFLTLDNGTLKLVSTDGRRLCFISTDGIADRSKSSAIIPSKAVAEIQRILSADSNADTVSVGLTENQLSFRMGGLTLVSRFIEGTFPNYEQVIPQKQEFRITMSSKALLSAVRQMAVLTNDRTGSDRGSTVKFLFSKGMLRVTASAQGLGTGESEIASDYDGANLEISFNPSFVIDILKNIDDEKVVMGVTGALTPAVFQPAGDSRYLCVVMPLRT